MTHIEQLPQMVSHDETSIELDARPGWYYVSVMDGPRTALVAGPWPTHAEACAALPSVKHVAYEVDVRSWFYAWGTARMRPCVKPRVGALNRELVRRRLAWLRVY